MTDQFYIMVLVNGVMRLSAYSAELWKCWYMHTYTAKTLTRHFAQEDERETMGTFALLNGIAQKQKEDFAEGLPSTLQVEHSR